MGKAGNAGVLDWDMSRNARVNRQGAGVAAPVQSDRAEPSRVSLSTPQKDSTRGGFRLMSGMLSPTLVRVILGLTLTVAALAADLPPLPKNALIISATQKLITSNGSNWRTSWGSFKKDYANKRVLIVNLKQLGHFDPEVSVSHYFIGRDVATRKFTVYSSGEKKATVGMNGDEVIFVSKDLPATSERDNQPPRSGTTTSASGHTVDIATDGKTMPTKKSGVTPHGWCIIVKQGTKIVGESASTPELVKWTKEYLANQPP